MADRDLSEYADALAFFGFSPTEKPDLLVLRSRKFNKERATRDPEERELIRRYYQVLTEGEKPTPPAPPPESSSSTCSTEEAAPSRQARSKKEFWEGTRQQDELDDVLPRIEQAIHRLHHDRVINNTFGLMIGLQRDLQRLVGLLQADASWVPDEDRQRLVSCLTSLYSSLILGALHKHELPVTNEIIRRKNAALQALGVPIPVGHEVIDPRDYDYSW